jgi:hypothetical protein
MGIYVPGTDSACTAGFMAQGRTTTTNRYVLTAGHCVERQEGGFGAWYARFANGGGHRLGTPPRSYAVFDSRGDVAIIRVESPGTDGWNLRPWVYTTSFSSPYKLVYPQDDYVIQRVARSAEILGEQVCKTGAISGTTCGELTGYGATFSWGGVTIRNLGRINGACTYAGDSGAPVFVGHAAYGVVSATEGILGECPVVHGRNGTNVTYYTGIIAAEDLTNVQVLTG